MTETAPLEARLRALEDLAEIQSLKARYLRGCDLQQPDDVRATLLPEAVVAYEGFPVFDNRDAFVQVFAEMGCQPGIYDMHHGSNPEIEVKGDRATGKWALFFQSINLTTRTITQMGVEYDDVYLRRDGVWLIAETRTRRTSFLGQSVGEDGILRVVTMGEPPATFG